MTQAITNLNINRNLLSQAQFYFSIERLPYVTFFGQQAYLPGVAIPSVPQHTPFTKIKRHGDHIEWESFKIEFKVDEDLMNWEELFNWIKGIGSPNDFSEFEAMKKNSSSISTKGSVYSDSTLTILNSNNIPSLKIEFVDIIPTRISGLQFVTNSPGLEYLSCTAEFDYTSYKITRIL